MCNVSVLGLSWHGFGPLPSLPDPGCKGGIAAWPRQKALLFTNAAKQVGLGACYGNSWIQAKWADHAMEDVHACVAQWRPRRSRAQRTRTDEMP